MGRYSCFWCPQSDFTDKNLEDQCPNCGRPYGYPLSKAPSVIGDYKIVKALSRGFYAATFLAEKGQYIKTSCVLKVSPKKMYDVFQDKNFMRECENHQRVAKETTHLVKIADAFEREVTFGNETLACFISELEYVEGDLLQTYLNGSKPVSAAAVAQIAIDLLRLRKELRTREVYHNDLHPENIMIKKLPPESGREYTAVDRSCLVVALDLGSVADGSGSVPGGKPGDLQRIAGHLNELVKNLLKDPDTLNDQEYRVADALQYIIGSISASAQNQRTPEEEELMEQIREAYNHSIERWKPWTGGISLKNFNAFYNAQTLQPSHVYRLFVDAGGWLNRISGPGPQIITGMRGCGKTMLLRALQFHARAVQQESGSREDALTTVKADDFVGLFVSAQRLMDLPDGEVTGDRDMFSRLVLAFGREAVRAILHLKDIDETTVETHAHEILASAIADCVQEPNGLAGVTSLYDLDNVLGRLLLGDSSSTSPPGDAFPYLAEAVRRCSPTWSNSRVLFLLDDVSTRYLSDEKSEQLASALLFQNDICAFKLTSETQTVELVFSGGGHPVRTGRDLEIFDLGAEVYEKIKARGNAGTHFVEDILRNRAQYYDTHPKSSPGKVLGNVDLEGIARKIGATPPTSADRKKIYYGLKALALVCVGDIGDVISLYDLILKKSDGSVPVSKEIQSECFQDFCARRLYELNRRHDFFKNAATSFAEASHERLIQSCRDTSPRIRQYSSLYVNITTGDLQEQREHLLQLIDAGVFVFVGGAPRAKTRDSNPSQQFKLAYRKIYGLSNFIGLADRDRFELSGPDLEQWLTSPSKKGLLHSVRTETFEQDEDEAEVELSPESVEENGSFADAEISVGADYVQIDFDSLNSSSEVVPTEPSFLPEIMSPFVEVKAHGDADSFPIDTVVTALGFEERTLESTRRIFSKTRPTEALVVQYNEPGYGQEIAEIISSAGSRLTMVNYKEAASGNELYSLQGNVLVDITGMAKPVIFRIIRNELRTKQKIWLCYTEAADYYPADDDLNPILSDTGVDDFSRLERLKHILTGEKGPYQLVSLLESDSDEARQRTLCAFSSAKHERLLFLLNNRDYDRIDIVEPNTSTMRGQAAHVVAEVAARNYVNSNIREIPVNDLEGLLEFITERYTELYTGQGLNFEMGLTGSKMQAVACAIVAATRKISRCWYVEPAAFDPLRFTKGTGDTYFYCISSRQLGCDDMNSPRDPHAKVQR